MKQIKIVVEKHADEDVAYPLGIMISKLTPHRQIHANAPR